MVDLRYLLSMNKGELTFHELISLKDIPEITFKKGELTEDEVDIIVEQTSLTNIYSNPFIRLEIDDMANTYKNSKKSIEEILSSIEETKKTIFKPKRRSKENALVRFEELVSYAKNFEELFSIGAAESNILNASLDAREDANKILSSPEKRQEIQAKADNLYLIASIKRIKKISETENEAYHDFLVAAELYSSVLSSIKNEESRNRTKEKGKLGLSNLQVYSITGKQGRLQDSYNTLKEYVEISSYNVDDKFIRGMEVAKWMLRGYSR